MNLVLRKKEIEDRLNEITWRSLRKWKRKPTSFKRKG